MLDLSRIAGLPLSLNENGLLAFGPDVVVDEHKERSLGALAPVVLEPDVCRGSQEIAYYMYNGVYRRTDAARLAGLPLRYELTLIPPRRIGREFIKTFGHIHSLEPKSGLPWAEVCEVVLGTAHFLFQTLDPAGPSADRAFYVEAIAGQKIIIPPGVDHLTINPAPEPLLFSDVIALGVSGDYGRYRASRGAVYLEIDDGGKPCFIPNPAYRRVPPLRRLELRDYSTLALTTDEPLYTAFVRTRGENWGFLTDPSLFRSAFPDLTAEISL